MLVKLMYQDADGIMNGEMHVNPEHIVSVRMRDDGKLGFMQLDSPDYRERVYGGQYGVYGGQYAITTFEVSPESYDRIVAWMEKHDG